MASKIQYTVNPLFAQYGKDYKLNDKCIANSSACQDLEEKLYENQDFVPADDWVYQVGERDGFTRKGTEYDKGLNHLNEKVKNVTSVEFKKFAAHSTFCIIKECCGKKLVKRRQPTTENTRMQSGQGELEVLGDVDKDGSKITLKNGKVIHKIANITTLHPWAYYGYLWAVPADIIAQIPTDLLKTDKMLYYTLHHSYNFNDDGYHRCQFVVYSEPIVTREPSKKKIKCEN